MLGAWYCTCLIQQVNERNGATMASKVQPHVTRCAGYTLEKLSISKDRTLLCKSRNVGETESEIGLFDVNLKMPICPDGGAIEPNQS